MHTRCQLCTIDRRRRVAAAVVVAAAEAARFHGCCECRIGHCVERLTDKDCVSISRQIVNIVSFSKTNSRNSAP